jgi:dihydrodipicolinate synthase/N-acetylneuraminate lyase
MRTVTDRRGFIKGASALAGVLSVGGIDAVDAAVIHRSPHGRPLAGVFPIGWTPCKPDNTLDLDAMVAQQRFLNRGKVAGIAWPQNASGWETLSPEEWHSGADALLSVKGKSAVILGVQTAGFNLAASVRYAQYAHAKGADAIISLTPAGASDDEIIRYFKALSAACDLPVMVQAVGNVSIDTVVALAQAVPAIVAVKDEAGDPLQRGPIIQARTDGKLEDFSGAGGHTFFPELEEGFLGTCPYVGTADVLQRCFDLYRAGKKRDAYLAFGAFLAFGAIPHSNEYVLIARGVFPEQDIMRANPAPEMPPEAARRRQGGGQRGAIDAQDKADIRRALDDYLKPYLVA